ncbi:MLP-like protein 423 [Malania oleifera]|uniref:MLP-like protein 423 n=1 Tax=Malania oleifera TaxID=397392 RepID=UPI0025AEAAC4|nr:MLP-like protein 423 [Malania oleifera]
MAQICKLETQTGIKCSPQMFFNIYKNKSCLMPMISPDKFQSIEVLEGDGKSVGSIRLWTYVMGGPVITKDRIDAIDEKNNSITYGIISGDVTKYYRNFKATLQAISEDHGKNVVKWTIEYEKANEDVPTPYSHLEFLANVASEIDAYLLKA